MKKKYYILAAALLLTAVAVGLALPEAAVRTGDARMSAKVQYAEGEALSMEGMEPLTLAEKMHIAGKSDRLYRMAVTEGTALHRDEALEIARRVCAAFQEAKAPEPEETAVSAFVETYTNGNSLLLWGVDMTWENGTLLSMSIDDETAAVLRLMFFTAAGEEPFSGFWTWESDDEQSRLAQLSALLGRALMGKAEAAEISVPKGEDVGTLLLRQEDGTELMLSVWVSLELGMINISNQ